MKEYFTAEKSESIIFMLAGLLAISFSAYALWKWGGSFYRGFAIPLILIGVIQLVVGGTVYFRTDRQLMELEESYRQEPGTFRQQELARMETVMNNFRIYKWVEVGFVVVGLLLILLLQGRQFWLGLGAGMLLQGAIMLTADVFAERRGRTYIEQVRKISWKQ